MSDKKDAPPETETAEALAKRVLHDLDVKADEAAQVKAGAKRRGDPCDGGE